MQSARSCTFAYMQDFAFLHIRIYEDQDILFYNPLYTRCKAKDLAHSHTCKILYSCTCASTKTLCFHPPLNARCNVQDLAHLHICKILQRSWTFAHVQVTILIMILFLHHLLPARCKVQDLAHLHTCKFQLLIKTLFLHHPLHAKCKMQDLAHTMIHDLFEQYYNSF